MKVILCGVGGFGQIWSDLNRFDFGVRVVGIVDPEPAALAAAGTELGLSAEARFATLQEAIASGPADAVIDSSPPSFHLDHALLSFEHGMHLLTAKPIAIQWADAVRMAHAAEAAALVLAVNEQFRFGWLPLAISHALQAGQIGAIESIQLSFRETSSWHGWRATMENPLLLDGAIQHFDMVRAVTGLEVESAHCRTWHREHSTFAGAGSASALFQLTGSVPLIYTATWDHHHRDTEDTTGWWGEWRIQGSAGDLRAHGKHGIWINGTPLPVAVEPPDVRRLSLVVLDQFVRAIRTGSPVPTDGWSDLRSLALSELCLRSARAGAPVTIRELEPDLVRK